MISSNRPTDWGPDRGGVQIGGGSRSGGGVQVKDLLSNTFFVLAVCGGKIFSNFLKFSRRGGGVPDRGGLSDTFLVLEFLWGIFFSNFLKFSRNTFLCIGILGKFSQIFSKFLKSFSWFWTKYLSQMMWGGVQIGWEGPDWGVVCRIQF